MQPGRHFAWENDDIMTVLGALHDALGNAEALIRLLDGER